MSRPPPKRVILPPLPPLKTILSNQSQINMYKGPTPYSNYIIPNIILTGSHPDHKNELKSLLEAGFTTFISLEEHFQAQLGTKAKQIKDYKRQAEILAKESKVAFKHHAFHLKNFEKQQASDLVRSISMYIIKSVDRGEKVYVHDFGGAGRSGVVSAIILGILYGIGGGEALGYIGKFHSLRESASSSASPENTSQRLFVYYIVDSYLKEIKLPQWRRIRLHSDQEAHLVLSPSTDVNDSESSLFDEYSTVNNSPIPKTNLPPELNHDFASSPQNSISQSPMNRSFEIGTNVDDDIDLLNNDNIREFSDMPQEKIPTKRRQSSRFDNLPFKIPNEPPTATVDMQGPIPQSNWIIKDRVCVGSFPIDTRFGQKRNRQLFIDPKSEATRPVRKLLDAGINVMVCLQAEVPILNNKTTDDAVYVSYDTKLQLNQRYGFKDRAGYTPYFDTVRTIATKDYGMKMTFIHFPIEEGNICKAEICSKLLHDLIDRIKMNQCIYIHGGTGHNRESMLGAGLLAALFDMNPADSIHLMNDLHNIRQDTQDVHESPSNHLQKMHVHEIIKVFKGIQSDRITTSSRDREFSTGNQNRIKNKESSIVFG